MKGSIARRYSFVVSLETKNQKFKSVQFVIEYSNSYY